MIIFETGKIVKVPIGEVLMKRKCTGPKKGDKHSSNQVTKT